MSETIFYLVLALGASLIGPATDPVMWIGPIVGAVCSRSWKLPVVLGMVGALLYAGIIATPMMVGWVFAGFVYGFIAFGIARFIRRKLPRVSRERSEDAP